MFSNYIKNHSTKSAAIVLALLVLIFISPAFFQGRYLAPVDTTHYGAPYLDITTQMLPWWNLSKEILRTGHFPFWNIYSGNGLPLMANMQSAIFFPLSWLFYIFNVRLALLLYAFLKLWLMGMFTYLYLKELKLKYYVCLLGAAMFAFCGANVIWFLWPLTSVILILPLSFFLIEKYFNAQQNNTAIPRSAKGEESINRNMDRSLHFSPYALLVGRDGTKKTVGSNPEIKYALWLAPITALGLFAGHPQTFFYVFITIYCYTIFKAFTSGLSIKRGFQKLMILSAIYFLGALISSVAVLPFLEYLKLSANLDYRAGFAENPFFLPKLLFLANLIPDFYGNTGVKNFSYLLVPNYGEIALGYIGLSGFVLSLFAFGKKVSKHVWFFLAMALLSAALIYHAPIIYHLINKLPGFSLNYNNRLLYLWAFFLIVLACFGLEKLLDRKISAKQFKWTWICFTVFAALMIAANRITTKSWNFAHNLDWHTVSLWQDVMIVAFLANLVVAYFIIKNLPPSFAKASAGDFAKRQNQKLALILLFCLMFIETGIHGMVFMKTSKPENFYPNEPALTYLQKSSADGNTRVFTYGDNLLPNIGTWYHINEINDHDTIYLTTNKKLKTYIGNYNYSPEYTFDEPNLNALRFLSVKYLLYPPKEGRELLLKYPNDLKLAFTDNSYSVLLLNDVLPRAFLINANNLDDLQSRLGQLIQNLNSGQAYPVSDFKISEDGTETISYNSETANYLVTTDNYYPDWLANFKAGNQEKVQNAFGLRVVPLTPGDGTIVISYHSQSFKLGLEITLGTSLIWLALAIFI